MTPLRRKILGQRYGADIRIGSGQTLVFTFDNLKSAGPNQGRSGWGADYLERRGHSVISFMESAHEGWYRGPSLPALIDEVCDLVDLTQFDRKIGYASSMGGYAVTAWAERLDLQEIILFSPISTLNQSLVPWENRFFEGKKRNWVRDCFDGADGLRKSKPKMHIVYDPLKRADHRHVARLCEAGGDATIYSMLGGTHRSLIALQRLGHLDWFVSEILAGTPPSQKEFRSKVRGLREEKDYYSQLAKFNPAKMTPGRRELLNANLARLAYRSNTNKLAAWLSLRRETGLSSAQSLALLLRHGRF